MSLPALALLLLATQPAPEPLGLGVPGEPSVPGVYGEPGGLDVTGEPEATPAALDGPFAFDALCRALEPSERLRGNGDAVALGEAADDHERTREAAIAGRYQVVMPAGGLVFARYDGPERRLALRNAVLPLRGGRRLFQAAEGGLPVEVEAPAARRVLAAQRKGELELVLLFDLADEAACSRGRPRTLAVEPVAWTWRAGTDELARGGAAAERPVVSSSGGARARVSVGEPLDGPSAARQLVEAREPALSACYAEALKRAPALDGVLVADLAPGARSPAIAADSVGDAVMVACVREALAGAVSAAGRAAVPIRFELEAP